MTVRVVLPAHLRTLAQISGEAKVDVAGAVTPRSVLDALEAAYPMLQGTIRDHVTLQRRAFVRFFACEQDLSLDSPDTPLPDAVASGTEPFLVVGAIAGGSYGMTESRRLIGESLRGALFTHKQWQQLAATWTHDHCQLCNAQIREHPREGDFSAGYVSYTPLDHKPLPFQEAGYVFEPAPFEPEGAATWICPPCFSQCREPFEWKLKT